MSGEQARPGYKRTEVGVIPAEWAVETLGQFADVIMGQSPIGSSYNQEEIGIALINGLTEFTDRYPIERQWTTSPTKVCQRGDILLCVRGSSTGRINIAGDEYCIGRGIAAIRAKANSEGAFLEYQVLRIIGKILSLTAGSTFPNIDGKSLRSIKASLPPLPEQRAIAEALADVDALLAALDRLIAKKRAIKQAAMQDLLTGRVRLPGFGGRWDVRRLGEITHSTAGGTPSTLVDTYWGGTIKWMSSGELHAKLVYDVEGRITEEGLKNSSAKILPPKCVLIGLAGQGKTRGTVAMNMVDLCTNQSIAAVSPSDCFVPEYLYFNLDARYDELRDLSTGEGGRGGLNLGIINSITVPLPSLPEQRAIAAVLSDMGAEIAALERRRAKTQAIKQGMMQELLTGRVRLR